MTTPLENLRRINDEMAEALREFDAVTPQQPADVAKLIEERDMLLNALKRALPHVEHAYHTNEDLDGSFWLDVCGCRNAIARCGGAK